MAFVNMFNDRVEQFNLREENERLAELFSDEKLQEEAQWQAYSVKEISRLFSISEEEALKLMNCGLFKTYRVGNEYRASKKSVEENKKIVKAVLTYQDNVLRHRHPQGTGRAVGCCRGRGTGRRSPRRGRICRRRRDGDPVTFLQHVNLFHVTDKQNEQFEIVHKITL